ncbi:MAG: hypothetical protein HWN65_14465, partial [Candidatus Helarchaeota archaeon]|nr:hypothetical protein [Candidatus Helarchaeota archaeon]
DYFTHVTIELIHATPSKLIKNELISVFEDMANNISTENDFYVLFDEEIDMVWEALESLTKSHPYIRPYLDKIAEKLG